MGAVAAAGARPGSGGVSRGRGDAELGIGDPNDPFTDSGFEAKRLTPAEYASLDQSVLVGVGLAAPKASGSGGESAGAARTARAGTRAGSVNTLRDRYRDAASSSRCSAGCSAESTADK